MYVKFFFSHPFLSFFFLLVLKANFHRFSYSQYQRLMILSLFLFQIFWTLPFLSQTSHCPGAYIHVLLIRTLIYKISSEKINKVPLLSIGNGVYALLQGMKPVSTTIWIKRCLSSFLAMPSLLTVITTLFLRIYFINKDKSFQEPFRALRN